MSTEIRIFLAVALAPVIVLLYFIYRKDRKSPEPWGQLLKAFFMGVLSIPIALLLTIPLNPCVLWAAQAGDVAAQIADAFFSAAIPEEAAKLLMLWLLLRKNKYFDEHMDGIVYAVFISMGFAAVENVLYLADSYDQFIAVGITRALFAVPGHFCYAILMGYYFSLVKFSSTPSVKNKVLVLLAPVLAHGIYDAILFVSEVSPMWDSALSMVFIGFCIMMWRYAKRRIEDHLKRDWNENRPHFIA